MDLSFCLELVPPVCKGNQSTNGSNLTKDRPVWDMVVWLMNAKSITANFPLAFFWCLMFLQGEVALRFVWMGSWFILGSASNQANMLWVTVSIICVEKG